MKLHIYSRITQGYKLIVQFPNMSNIIATKTILTAVVIFGNSILAPCLQSCNLQWVLRDGRNAKGASVPLKKESNYF